MLQAQSTGFECVVYNQKTYQWNGHRWLDATAHTLAPQHLVARLEYLARQLVEERWRYYYAHEDGGHRSPFGYGDGRA